MKTTEILGIIAATLFFMVLGAAVGIYGAAQSEIEARGVMDQ